MNEYDEYEPYDDTDETSLFKPITRKARKDYDCANCGMVIHKGETYVRQGGICHISEKHFSVAHHEQCPRVIRLLYDALIKLEDESFRAFDARPELVQLGKAVKQAKEVLEQIEPNRKKWGGY
jgi:hypothetical protein